MFQSFAKIPTVLILVLILSFLFIPAGFCQKTMTENELRTTQYVDEPASQLSVSFAHTSAQHSVDSGTNTNWIDVSQFECAAVTIKTASLAAGAITTASYQIYLSASNTVAGATQSTVYELERGNAADTAVYMALPTIENYGTYLVNLGGARRMSIRANGLDLIARRVDLGLK